MHLSGRTRRVEEDGVVVELDGDADLASVPQLDQVLTRALGTAEVRRVVVDLDGLTVLDDAALGHLVGTAASARHRAIDFELVCTNERVRHRLHDTRIDQIIDVVDPRA